MKATARLVTLIIGIVLIGCQRNEQVTPPSSAETDIPLQKVTWRLVSFESGGGVIAPLPNTETFFIAFRADTLFDGHTTVNSYGGSYVSDSRQKTVEVRYIISTKAYGGPNEAKFYDGLRRVVQYRATDDGRVKRLRLFYGTDNDVLNFVGS